MLRLLRRTLHAFHAQRQPVPRTIRRAQQMRGSTVCHHWSGCRFLPSHWSTKKRCPLLRWEDRSAFAMGTCEPDILAQSFRDSRWRALKKCRSVVSAKLSVAPRRSQNPTASGRKSEVADHQTPCREDGELCGFLQRIKNFVTPARSGCIAAAENAIGARNRH